MKKIMVKLLLVMSLALPVFVHAQEVDTPTPDFPTQELATITPDIITATPSPTDDPTATPAPTETPIPVPPPIDQTKVFESIFTVVMVLIVGAVTLGLAVLVVFFKMLAAPVRAILLSAIKTGVDEAGKFANTTETPLDDLAVVELRKLVARLESELNQVKAQVQANTSDIQAATQNR